MTAEENGVDQGRQRGHFWNCPVRLRCHRESLGRFLRANGGLAYTLSSIPVVA